MLVLFSNNPEKFQEYQELLGVPELRRNRLPSPEAQAVLLEELTRLKVEEVINCGFAEPFFVEHTGLFIDAWEGLPGGLTAQFMATVHCEGLCRMMSSYHGDERMARAKVAIGYWRPDRKQLRLFQAETRGLIADRPCGDCGFGWDSIFIPETELPGAGRTYGEMSFAEKNRTSPRWKAAADFAATLARGYSIHPPASFAPLVRQAAAVPEERRSQTQILHIQSVGHLYAGPTLIQQLTILDPDLKNQITDLVTAMRRSLPELALAPAARSEAEAELQSLEAQVSSPKPKRVTLQAALEALGEICKGATVTALADGMVEAIRQILGKL